MISREVDLSPNYLSFLDVISLSDISIVTLMGSR